jgi:O-methyltransferase involved in polyketide biosynthesis
VRRGVDRYLMLGAGLDGFSYRSLLMAQLQALEVDHLVVVVHY